MESINRVPKARWPDTDWVLVKLLAISFPKITVRAEKKDIIDFDLGNKITGAGFPVYKDKGAKLQRALINYFIDKNTEAGYKEIQVPILVNEDSGMGTGNLPDKNNYNGSSC